MTTHAHHKFFKYVLLILAGMISVLAFAPFDKSFLIAPSILTLIFILEKSCATASKRSIFAYGYVYAVAYFISQLYWIFYCLYSVIQTGFIIAVSATLIFTGYLAMFIALAGLIYHMLKTKYTLFNLLFLFPSLWVLCEWLRGWLFTGFPWGEVGYTQVNLTFFRGLYPLIGNYGVSWLCLSLIGVLYIILNANHLPKQHFRTVIIYAAAILVLGNLIADKNYTKPYGKPITVALVQGNIAQNSKWSTDQSLAVYKRAINDARADIIMIPETAISQFAQFLPKNYLNNLIDIANSKGAALIVGMPKIIDRNNNYVNAAILLTNGFNRVITGESSVIANRATQSHPYYAKRHLVPYGEYIPMKWLLGPVYKYVSLPMVGFSAGAATQPTLAAANQKLAFNICYENGFNTELITDARNSTIMANLSDMVWYGNSIAKDEHLQISQARALENQRYFVQDTNTGMTAIIKQDGQIKSQLPSFKLATLTDTVQGRIGETPFEKYGNYPILIWCILLVLAGLFF